MTAKTTLLSNQHNPTLVDEALKTIVAPVNTQPAARELREGIKRAISQFGYDTTADMLDDVLTAFEGLASAPTVLRAPELTLAEPVVGVPIAVTMGLWNGIPRPVLTYQWRRNTSNISGATDASYTPVALDIGADLDVVITANNGESPNATLTIEAGEVQTAADYPINTVPPVASGTPNVGQTLSVTNGTWTPATGLTFTYQWLNNGVAIPDATENTYELQASDEGDDIRCRVRATNAKDQFEDALSNVIESIGGEE